MEISHFKFSEWRCHPSVINAWHTNPSLGNLCWLWWICLCVLPVCISFLLLTILPSYPLPQYTITLCHSVLYIHSVISHTFFHTHCLSQKRTKISWIDFAIVPFVFWDQLLKPSGFSFSHREKSRQKECNLDEKELHFILLVSAQLFYKPHFVWVKECWEAWAADVSFCGK